MAFAGPSFAQGRDQQGEGCSDQDRACGSAHDRVEGVGFGGQVERNQPSSRGPGRRSANTVGTFGFSIGPRGQATRISSRRARREGPAKQSYRRGSQIRLKWRGSALSPASTTHRVACCAEGSVVVLVRELRTRILVCSSRCDTCSRARSSDTIRGILLELKPAGHSPTS